MRRYIVIGIALGFLKATLALSQTLWGGTQEVHISGSFYQDSVEGTLWQGNIAYGFFPWDYVGLYIKGGWLDSDVRRMKTLGLTSELNYDVGSRIFPYLGFGVAFVDSRRTWNCRDGSKEVQFGKDFAASGEAGLKIFLTEKVALSPALSGIWSGRHVFPSKKGMKNHQLQATLAFRFFF